MQSISRRIIQALVLSATCFAVTHYWYVSTEPDQNLKPQDSTPLAMLMTHENEVLARPAQKLVWYPTEDNKEFYPGDALRTSSRATAQIRLNGQNRNIELEADSVIIFEEDQDQLSLNVLEGQVFVEAPKENQTPTKSLVLKQGNQKIDLTEASAKVEIKDSTLHLEVFEGKAKTLDQAQNETITKGSQFTIAEDRVEKIENVIQVFSPKSHEVLKVPEGEKKEVTFKWKSPLTEQVRFRIGRQRNKLKEFVLRDQDSSLNSQSMKFQLPPGKYYWQVAASSGVPAGSTYESPLYKFAIKGITLPTAVMPADQAELSVDEELKFQWAVDESYHSVVLQVAGDPQFLKKEKRHKVPHRGQYQVTDLEPGKYYWRVIAYDENKEAKISSTKTFVLGEKQKPVVREKQRRNVILSPTTLEPAPEKLALDEKQIEEKTAQENEAQEKTLVEATTPAPPLAVPPTPEPRKPASQPEESSPLKAPKIKAVEVL